MTLVHLGVNQVLGFLHLSELFLDCMFSTVETCLQMNLLLVILFWNFIEQICDMSSFCCSGMIQTII